MEELLNKARAGFDSLAVDGKYKEAALTNIKVWLSDEQFSSYVPQIRHMIERGHWDYLLDCFYQVIPFGTGGRRGEVGIGPNRINVWTIRASAQGHSQYLKKRYGEEVKSRGVVLTYDVRQFFSNRYFDDSLPNPVRNLNCKELAIAASEVYAANDVKVYMFEDVRTTPELSFAIRYLKALGGDMFSASHNPPEHNGKKIYDEFGGQLVPPEDTTLVAEVTENVKQIKVLDYSKAVNSGLIVLIGKEVDDAFVDAAAKLSLSEKRDIKIVYTPLHGCGSTSVLKVLRKLGFVVNEDPRTSNPSGKFENVTFNIPNPEVEQSFDTPLKYAREIDADILLNSDPDADRIGVSVKHGGDWVYLNGNEIAAILAEYVAMKKASQVGKAGVMIKTMVTTDIVREICKAYGFELAGDLLVGFKYIGQEMNRLEKENRIDKFLFGCEESHGYIAGNYLRDKDASVAAIWLSELAAELRLQGKTLVDYLEQTYAKYGFFRNYLTEIRLPGAEGKSMIDKIQQKLRAEPPKKFGDFIIEKAEDMWNRKPIVSETDKSSKDVLVYHFKPVSGTISLKVTIRPSGTEPKSKMYFEVGSKPFAVEKFASSKELTEKVVKDLEKAVLKDLYKIIGIDFPDRGFLLFWQLPVTDKMKYFEMEPKIAELVNITDIDERKTKLAETLKFLGSDPTQKVNKAFAEKYGKNIEEYLKI
jgi:phosphoglucomutase/phosphomannomutase